LFDLAVEVARARGRSTLTGDYVAQLDGGPARGPAPAGFAGSVGAKSALASIRRRLDISTVDRSAWAGLVEQARQRADGYSVVRWQDHAPEEHLEDLARLEGRMVLDAPIGDLDLEPQAVDRARVLATEQVCGRRYERRYQVGVRHESSGRLVGYTVMHLDGEVGTHAWQENTIVDPAHRGHRLGQLIKVENLWQALAAEPELRVVNTWNAAENQYMIAVNDALGYRPVEIWVGWQVLL
jgi:hypothetical protein